jgi:hypothetical protein
MPQSRQYGAGSDTMQQMHGAGMKSNELLSITKITLFTLLNTSLSYDMIYLISTKQGD